MKLEGEFDRKIKEKKGIGESDDIVRNNDKIKKEGRFVGMRNRDEFKKEKGERKQKIKKNDKLRLEGEFNRKLKELNSNGERDSIVKYKDKLKNEGEFGG